MVRPALAPQGQGEQPVAALEVELGQGAADRRRAGRQDGFDHADLLRLQGFRLGRGLEQHPAELGQGHQPLGLGRDQQPVLALEDLVR